MTVSAFLSDRRKAPRPSVWRWIALLQFLIISVSAITPAVVLAPEPYSDWLYYWEAANGGFPYQRGGAGLGLLALLRWAGLPPPTTALLLNLPCAAALLWIAYRTDRAAWKLHAQLVAAYLWLVSPFYGIVQLDLIAATLLVGGCWLLLAAPWRSMRAFTATILVMAAVSTRPQLALVLWAMILLLLAARLLLLPMRHIAWPRVADLFVAVMLVASVCGFVVDYALRARADQTGSMRTSSAVTLYGGLLVSGTGPGCGYWSERAADAAIFDARKPLSDAIADRLSAEPFSHWLGVVACKAPQILLPPPYALNWAIEAPNVRSAMTSAPDREWLERIRLHARTVENVLYRGLALLILAAAFGAGWKLRHAALAWALLPPIWILAFWSVHAIFEIQGRYFLPMLLVTPILAALALSRGANRSSAKIAFSQSEAA